MKRGEEEKAVAQNTDTGKTEGAAHSRVNTLCRWKAFLRQAQFRIITEE